MKRATGWRWLLWVTLAAGCGESSPVDMWISRNPEAGAGFEAPVREVGVSDVAVDTAGAAGAGGGEAGSSGTGGAGGSAVAGTGGSGTTGSGGAGGAGGDSGQ